MSNTDRISFFFFCLEANETISEHDLRGAISVRSSGERVEMLFSNHLELSF